MHRYMLRRLLIALPTIIGISLVTFLLLYILPGDPITMLMADRLDQNTIEMLRTELGLDAPKHIQYLKFITRAVRGDFGFSYQTRRNVTDMLKSAFAATGKVALAAYGVSIVLGIPLGIYAALRHNSWADIGSMFCALLGISLPPFVVALALLYIFGFKLKLFPLGGYGTAMHLVLPAMALGIRPAAMLARLTRSGMLEVLRQDYLRTARSKGLKERVVVAKHALKNCLIPITTVMGGQISGLLGGAVVLETVFAWPGVGKLSVEAMRARDFPVVQASVLISALIVVFINLFIDLSYGFLDPRIRYE